MTLDRDDELLTALSHGVRPDPDDALAELLADWRADLDTDLPPVPAVRRRRWFLRPVAVGLAAGILALGGTTAMASTAGPDSPLWPITQRVYPAKAQSRIAEQAAIRLLNEAATAIQDRRYTDAVTALNDAAVQINLVTDVPARDRLVQRWTDLVTLLFRSAPSVAPPPANAPGSSAAPAPKPSTAPSPSGSGSSGGVLPLPLPSLPGPLPSLPLPQLPLPSILPSLPPLLR